MEIHAVPMLSPARRQQPINYRSFDADYRRFWRDQPNITSKIMLRRRSDNHSEIGFSLLRNFFKMTRRGVLLCSRSEQE
jgi:hypothetical protein